MKRLNIEAATLDLEERATHVAGDREWSPLVSAAIGRSYGPVWSLRYADAWAEVAEAHLFATDGKPWSAFMLRRLRMVWPENRPGPIVPVYVTDDLRCMDWRVLERPEAARRLGWPSPWASGDPAVEEAATLAAAAKMAAPRSSTLLPGTADLNPRRVFRDPKTSWTFDGSLLDVVSRYEEIDVDPDVPLPGSFPAMIGVTRVGSVTIGPRMTNGRAEILAVEKIDH